MEIAKHKISHGRKSYNSTFKAEYCKRLRGCNPSHRWVQLNNPDSTWKKLYYTSSYTGPNFNVSESYPDTITQTVPTTDGNNIVISRAGYRGLVWKEQTNSSTTLYRYSFLREGSFRDRYDYYSLIAGPNGGRQFVLQTSTWARLDSVITTRDGVTDTSAFVYNPTRRELSTGNGLLNRKIEKGNSYDRITDFSYAYSKSS